jgi:hypothetical protein
LARSWRLQERDRGDLYELFKGCPDIAFLKLPANQHPHVSRFLRAAGIALVSEAVEIEPVVTNQLHEHRGLTARCRQAVPFIIRYLFSREQDSFREWQESGTAARLGQMEIKVCDDLHVDASLNGVQVSVRQRFASRASTVFVSRGEEDDIDGLAAELARMLRGSPGLKMFIAAALSRTDARAIERLMQAQGIPQLPEGEENIVRAAVVAGEFSPDEEPADAEAASEPAADDDEMSQGENLDEWEDAPADDVRDAIGVPPETGGALVPAGPKVASVPLPDGTSVSATPRPPPHRDGDAGQEATASDTPVPSPGAGPGGPVPASPGSSAEGTIAPPTWSQVCGPEEATPRLSDVTPSVAEGRTRATTTRSGRKEPAAAGKEVPEARTPGPHAKSIGGWGEEYALACLKAELSARHRAAEVVKLASGFRFLMGGRLVAEVRWLNWDGGEGVGRDIDVIEEETTEYVEVKATADAARASFEVTAAEWDLARQSGPAYRIIRVFNAGTPEARADSYRDPYRLWQEGRLTARPLQIVI